MNSKMLEGINNLMVSKGKIGKEEQKGQPPAVEGVPMRMMILLQKLQKSW